MNYRDSDIDRVLKAIRHQPTDRVPNFEIVIRERNVDAILGSSGHRKASQLPAHEYVELAQRIGMDAVNVRLRWRLGWIDERTDHYVGGTIRGLEDLRRAEPPVARTLTYIPGQNAPFGERLDSLRQAAAGTGVGVCVVVGGVFSSAYLAMGLDKFMLALYDKRELVEKLMDLMTDFGEQLVLESCRRGAAFIIIADDMALDTGPMIRPALLEDLWLPRIARLIGPAHERGLPVVLHSDGDLTAMLPMIIQAGIDGIHPCQPVNKLDIYAVKQKFGQQLCLFGNIDLSGVLSFGEPEEVAEDVRQHIDKLAPGSGYVCGSSHGILDSVPPPNMAALVDAVHRHGQR